MTGYRSYLPILALVLLAVWGIPGHAQEPLTNNKILRNFNIVAFGNEYTHKRYKNVRKWVQPIRFGIQGKYPPYFEKFVREHIRNLWELTGHPIELYYSLSMQKAGRLAKDFDPKKVNFILYYLPTKDIYKAVGKHFDNDPRQVQFMVDNSTCFAKFFTRNNEIVAGFAVFPDHRPKDHMWACVVEELTQILGLANDSADVNPSIFNDVSQHFSLTEHDKWMIRMFYDPRITAGMPRELAIDMGRKILSEIRPENPVVRRSLN
ncbi:MAG: DUF2927 domain-containing protein [Rhodospirillales bacterium]|nr:DUF2927 domain-containing protein [Rhodospirillales bacterium]